MAGSNAPRATEENPAPIRTFSKVSSRDLSGVLIVLGALSEMEIDIVHSHVARGRMSFFPRQLEIALIIGCMARIGHSASGTPTRKLATRLQDAQEFRKEHAGFLRVL